MSQPNMKHKKDAANHEPDLEAADAKAATAAVKQDLATTNPAGQQVMSPTDMQRLMAGDGDDDYGKDDIAIPFIRILQPLSPQVDKKNEAYIPGAEPGMILNTVTGEVFDGDKGIVAVQVRYQRELTEWKDRDKGGGLVKNHGQDLSALDGAKLNDKGRPITAEGNTLVEAGTNYIYVIDPTTGAADQAVIPMASTQFKASRTWNSLIRMAKVPDGVGGFIDRPAPFAYSYLLKTQRAEKGTNAWYVWTVERFALLLDLPNGQKIAEECMKFRQLIRQGKVKVAVENPATDDEAAGSDAHKAF